MKSGHLACLVCLALTAIRTVQAQEAGDYVIGPQDVLTVSVYDEPGLGGKFVVEPDGTITYPLVGRVTAGGMTVRNLETNLRQRLADGFVKNPQVTVAIEFYRSQRVFVTGEVRAPGAYPLAGTMTLLEAIVSAGSTTALAADEVSVVRTGQAEERASTPGAPEQTRTIIRVNLRNLQSGVTSAVENITLRDGDTIYVPPADLIYLFGHVRTPGSYPIKSTTTVLQALSLAGGVLPSAALNRIRVVRLVDGQKKETRITLADLVRPGDTLIIPERFF